MLQWTEFNEKLKSFGWNVDAFGGTNDEGGDRDVGWFNFEFISPKGIN